MRAVAFSVWIFINLAFLGMGGYIYLILSTYWCRKMHTLVQPIPPKKIKFDRKNQVIFYETKEVLQEQKTEGRLAENSSAGENFLLLKKHLYRLRRRSPPREKPCPGGDVGCSEPNGKNESQVEDFKNKLFIQMRRVMHEESNVFKTDNPYFVNYKGPKGSHQRLSPEEIKCRLKKVGLRLLNRKDYPFSKNKFGEIMGDEVFLGGKHFNTCAIVSSAASLLNSELGRAIDSHDIVLRFNHAPTEHFEKDVGTKTTIRLVNSQVVSKKEFKFTTSPLYSKVCLVVWDPSNYSSTLKQVTPKNAPRVPQQCFPPKVIKPDCVFQWFEKPDFNFFDQWAEQKIKNSKKDSFIVDPQSVWKTWDFIQSLTTMRIRRNPPSSGFLGLALLMPYCDVIDFFEFVPSIRLTKKCHYFDSIQDASCTFGVWHPLSAEKMLSLAMNEANDSTVFESGFIRIRGYRNLRC